MSTPQTLYAAALDTITDLRAQLARSEKEAERLIHENKRLNDQTSAGYVFNQMRLAWEALGGEKWAYRPQKFVEKCRALRAQLAQSEQECERLRTNMAAYVSEAEANYTTLQSQHRQARELLGEAHGEIARLQGIVDPEVDAPILEDFASRIRAYLQSAPPPESGVEGKDTGLFQSGKPSVPSGGRQVLWCATRNSEGKIFHRHLAYLNAYIMPLSDSQDDPGEDAVPIGDDGDYAWSGWFEESCDQCETQWRFTDEVVAWMRLPRLDAARSPKTDRPTQ